MKKTTLFKSYILDEEILMMPVAHDALTAKIIQQVGFKATCAAGYGNVTNVIRTVRLFEKAGCAGLLIEDQQEPKRCGHMSGKQVVPAWEMAAKIRAALDARSDPDFVIMPRTDALARAVKSLLEDLQKTGSLSGLEERMMQFEEFNRLVGLQEIREEEDRYYRDVSAFGLRRPD